MLFRSSGMAGNYVQLLLARVGVAAGESVSGPATMSIIGDLYPAQKRGGAIGVLTVGAALGYSLGAVLAGALNDRFGWHVAMMAVGAPGLLLALLMFLTVGEPKRGVHDRTQMHEPGMDSVWLGLKRIAAIRTAAPLLLGSIFLNFAFLAWLNWVPAFLMRVHHLKTTEMSAIFGLVAGLGGVASNLVAGLISDRLARWGTRWRMYYCCIMIACAVPPLVAALLLRDFVPSIICMTLFTLAAGGLTTVTGAATLSISPPRLRAFMAAVFGLAVTVLGAGAGPWIIGALNDALKGSYGEQAVRYSLLLAPAAFVVAGAMFFWASRTIGEDAAVIASDAG